MMYFGINIAGALLIILGTILYILGLIMYGIIKCCGFCKITTTTKSRFPPRSRGIFMTVVLLLFVAFLFLVLILCQTKGAATMFDGISGVSDGPAGVATIVFSAATALQSTFINLSEEVLLPTLVDLNSTICNVINWQGIETDLKLLNHSLYDLPNIRHVRSLLHQVQSNTNNITSLIDDTLNDITTITNEKSKTVNATYVVLADLAVVNNSLIQINRTLTQGQVAVGGLQNYFTTFFGAAGPTSYSFSDTDGLLDSLQHDVTAASRNDTPGRG